MSAPNVVAAEVIAALRRVHVCEGTAAYDLLPMDSTVRSRYLSIVTLTAPMDVCTASRII